MRTRVLIWPAREEFGDYAIKIFKTKWNLIYVDGTNIIQENISFPTCIMYDVIYKL